MICALFCVMLYTNKKLIKKPIIRDNQQFFLKGWRVNILRCNHNLSQLLNSALELGKQLGMPVFWENFIYRNRLTSCLWAPAISPLVRF